MLKNFLIIIGFSLTVFFASITNSYAQTITVEVSGNGEGSNNANNVVVNQETTVTQNNTAAIQNDVNTNANTGENLANSNTGNQTQINTGNINQNLEISNKANSSITNLSNCCPQNLEITNSGNGASSENTITTQVSNSINITVVNEANIANTANVTTNTGANVALGNGGNVSIETGNIKISGKIKNLANHSFIKTTSGAGDISVINKSNGANSVNNLLVAIINELNIEKIDIAAIFNDVEIEANTGQNLANENLGDVQISTGDIDIDFSIINDPINFSVVEAGCECKVAGGPQPPVPPVCDPCPEEQPPQPAAQPAGPAPTGPSEAQAGPSGPGQVLVALAQLPVTGPGNLIYLLLLWISLFLTGVVLKRLGNRSPPVLVFHLK